MMLMYLKINNENIYHLLYLERLIAIPSSTRHKAIECNGFMNGRWDED